MIEKKVKWEELLEILGSGMGIPVGGRPTTTEEVAAHHAKIQAAIDSGNIIMPKHTANWEVEGVPPKAIQVDEGHSDTLCMAQPDGSSPCNCPCDGCTLARETQQEAEDDEGEEF